MPATSTTTRLVAMVPRLLKIVCKIDTIRLRPHPYEFDMYFDI